MFAESLMKEMFVAMSVSSGGGSALHTFSVPAAAWPLFVRGEQSPSFLRPTKNERLTLEGLFEPGQVVTLRYRINDKLSLEAVQGTLSQKAGINYRVEKR